MFQIFDAFSPSVEPLSVDEAFLDLTGTERLLGPPEEVAQRLKTRIKADLGLNASVGVAPNKFLAKVASDLKKPDALVVVKPEEVQDLLRSLPVHKLWGVGPVTARRLGTIGIEKVSDLHRFTIERLENLLGTDAQRLMRLSHGEDDREVVPDRQAKSIGQEQTFGVDLIEPEDVRRVLFEQVEQVGRRLRQYAMSARTVSLKIRYGEFETISRSTTLSQPTSGTAISGKRRARCSINGAWPGFDRYA